jgi:hypothetical protein
VIFFYNLIKNPKKSKVLARKVTNFNKKLVKIFKCLDLYYHFCAIGDCQHKGGEQWFGMGSLSWPALNRGSHRQTKHGHILREWKISVILSGVPRQNARFVSYQRRPVHRLLVADVRTGHAL